MLHFYKICYIIESLLRKASTYAVSGWTHRVVKGQLDWFAKMFEAHVTVSTIVDVAVVLADALEAKRNGPSSDDQAQRA